MFHYRVLFSHFNSTLNRCLETISDTSQNIRPLSSHITIRNITVLVKNISSSTYLARLKKYCALRDGTLAAKLLFVRTIT